MRSKKQLLSKEVWNDVKKKTHRFVNHKRLTF
jgi:hypothetical protein